MQKASDDAALRRCSERSPHPVEPSGCDELHGFARGQHRRRSQRRGVLVARADATQGVHGEDLRGRAVEDRGHIDDDALRCEERVPSRVLERQSGEAAHDIQARGTWPPRKAQPRGRDADQSA
jgi:hypothetical protein